MFSFKLHFIVTLAATALALVSVRRAGWLDRVVAYHRDNFIKDVQKHTPIEISAEIGRKPPGYVDSAHWDYDSVIRLLTLIRQSEKAKPVHIMLRRMLQPTRRIMMSIKESMKHFPSLTKNEKNSFYYDIDYADEEESSLPPGPPIPEDEVVVMVTNPVEARLPSARISVKLLREILEARAIAARQTPSTTASSIPWKPMAPTKKPPNRYDAPDGPCGDNGDADGTEANETSTPEGGPEGATEGEPGGATGAEPGGEPEGEPGGEPEAEA